MAKVQVIRWKELASYIFFLFVSLFLAVLISYLVPFGRDFLNYDDFYYAVSSGNASLGEGDRFEFGFKLLAKLGALIVPYKTASFWLLVVWGSLYIKSVVFYHFASRRFLKAFIFFLFYLASFLFVFELNQLRAAIAIGLGYFAFYKFVNGKHWTAYFCFFLAFSFHYSSIVFGISFFAYLLVKRGYLYLLIGIITGIGLMSRLGLSVIETLNPLAQEYKENAAEVEFGIRSLSVLFPLVYFIYHIIFIKREPGENVAMIMFLYVGLIFSLMMSSIPVYAIRILELTEVSCLIITMNRRFKTIFDYGSLFLLLVIVLHKFIAFVFVNPLFSF
ncbi:EpsG family protein [Chitinophaga varians]|uniref:EpsG family protein n=1 Tax=Chitinophaga varians TaxID=2202339 RepID=A0A847RQV7_9BACT|nr:EpsG family protein [Chitinophaga varians]NLR65292.1 EpsG family protein [Chitinophaga varians]